MTHPPKKTQVPYAIAEAMATGISPPWLREIHPIPTPPAQPVPDLNWGTPMTYKVVQALGFTIRNWLDQYSRPGISCRELNLAEDVTCVGRWMLETPQGVKAVATAGDVIAALHLFLELQLELTGKMLVAGPQALAALPDQLAL